MTKPEIFAADAPKPEVNTPSVTPASPQPDKSTPSPDKPAENTSSK